MIGVKVLRKEHKRFALFQQQTHPIVIRGDNNGSIAMARNPQFHQRIVVLTKPLTRFKHNRHITTEMGMVITLWYRFEGEL